MRNARWQLVHMASGIVILFLLGTHMISQHLDKIAGFLGMQSPEPTSWLAVSGRSGMGIWAGLYIALLAFALYHALYGLRGILLEVTPSGRAGKAINVSFIIVGILIFAWGAYIPLKLL